MDKIMYAKVTGTVTWSGGTAVLQEGRTTAHPDHALVKERPDLWKAESGRLDFPAPQAPQAPVEAPPAPVERATRAPGERRSTRRRA